MKKYARIYNTPEYRRRYTGIYGSWSSMKQRCSNPKNAAYPNYGGRGINFPESWQTFSGFCRDMRRSYKKGLFLERIDNEASYSRENCRWATRKENNNNKRSNILLKHRGLTLPIALWAEKIGVPFSVVRSRFYRGMPVRKVLSTKMFHRYGARKLSYV